MERRSVTQAVEVAEGLANKRNSQTSPARVLTRSHDQDRHELLVGDVGELEGHQGRGRAGAGAAAARAVVEFFGKVGADIGARVGERHHFFRCFRAGRALAFRLSVLL